jgi:ribosomal protein S18 acetylase RimI-like enzyme
MSIPARWPPGVTLTPAGEADIRPLQELAATIWREHYTAIIGAEQVEYMLGRRYTPDRIRDYFLKSDRWLDLLRSSGRPVGYCSHSIGEAPGEMTIEQLYLLESQRGRGLGKVMLAHVESSARRNDCRTLVLTVNRQNTASIDFYRAMGFLFREEAVFDIGGGFKMDDFVMEKRLD